MVFSSSSMEVEFVDEQWDQCSAVKCLRPKEKSLKWIQCEACKGWNHFICAGLDACRSYEDSYFACLSCWKPSIPIVLDEGDRKHEAEVTEFLDTDVLGLVFRPNCGVSVAPGRPVRAAAVKCRVDFKKNLVNL